MQKPNFFIIGAAKSGTTSLYEYLNQHPDIYFSPIKEPNYFSTDIKVENFSPTYRKNNHLDAESYFSNEELPKLQLSFIRDRGQYEALFSGAKGEQAVGECSTSYLFSTEAASNIKHFNPNSRIIAILRNPIERAFSHYLMALRYGYTRLGFHQALEEDMRQPVKGWGISELFIELGQYYEQLNRYYRQFPHDQIKVYLYDDLREKPFELIRAIQQFLGVTPEVIETEEKHNEARIPKFKWLNKLLADLGIKTALNKALPNQTADKLKNVYFSSSDADKPVMEEDDKQFLKDVYRHDITRTGKLIGRDLDFWLEL
ncbi:MAG: sulfotransferase [Bacteroidales bacterium]|nr:sulfotransferase [Bacteroidales bacterium]